LFQEEEQFDVAEAVDVEAANLDAFGAPSCNGFVVCRVFSSGAICAIFFVLDVLVCVL
jgi:hypothetical protein